MRRDTGVYVTALQVTEIFADPTYQRPVDKSRARRMDNRKPGRKILVSNRTFGGGSLNARSVRSEAS